MMPAVLLAAALAQPDDTAMLQRMIDRCAPGGTVTLPAGRHSVSTLRLKPNCAYSGAAAGTTLELRGKNTFLMDLSERSDIRLTGIEFDANELGGALLMQGYAPVRGIQVRNCRFRNVVAASTYPANLTIFSSWGIIDSSFIGNTFNNVSGGISLTTVQNVTISDNTFTNVTQSDAIFIAPNPVKFPAGDGLRITGNTGRGIAKMGIEIFRPDPPNGSRLVAPLIENNRFQDFTAANGEGMGLSITHGENAIVRGNRIDNSAGRHQENGIGIEIIVRGADVRDNVVTGGFGYGIAVQGTPGAVIAANRLIGIRKDAILFACDRGRNRCDSSGSRIESNEISDAGNTGINLQNPAAGVQILSNTISVVNGEGIREFSPGRGSIIRANTVTRRGRPRP